MTSKFRSCWYPGYWYPHPVYHSLLPHRSQYPPCEAELDTRWHLPQGRYPTSGRGDIRGSREREAWRGKLGISAPRSRVAQGQTHYRRDRSPWPQDRCNRLQSQDHRTSIQAPTKIAALWNGMVPILTARMWMTVLDVGSVSTRLKSRGVVTRSGRWVESECWIWMNADGYGRWIASVAWSRSVLVGLWEILGPLNQSWDSGACGACLIDAFIGGTSLAADWVTHVLNCPHFPKICLVFLRFYRGEGE